MLRFHSMEHTGYKKEPHLPESNVREQMQRIKSHKRALCGWQRSAASTKVAHNMKNRIHTRNKQSRAHITHAEVAYTNTLSNPHGKLALIQLSASGGNIVSLKSCILLRGACSFRSPNKAESMEMETSRLNTISPAVSLYMCIVYIHVKYTFVCVSAALLLRFSSGRRRNDYYSTPSTTRCAACH